MIIVCLFMTVFVLYAQTGWPDSSILELPESYYVGSDYVAPPFPTKPQPLSLLNDTLTTPLGWLTTNFLQREIEVYIDRDWNMITLTEFIDGEIYRIPFTAPLGWYVENMISVKRQIVFVEQVSLTTQDGKDGSGRDGKGITIDLMDIGALGTASLRVRGNIGISGKMVFRDQELVRSTLNQSQTSHLEFEQKQNLNVDGKIGDRITILLDNDSENVFDWENNIHIAYEGAEDDIIQKVDAGNIVLSLPGTQLATSDQNNELFGIKAVSKFGPVDVTTIASIEKVIKEQQEYEGTNQVQALRIRDYNYVDNQYFFINLMYRNGVQNLQTEYMGQPKIIRGIPPYYPLVNIVDLNGVNLNGVHRIGRYAVREFELYRMDRSTEDPTTIQGTVYEDINNPSDNDRNVNFKRLDNDIDYTLSADLGFIRMRSRASDDDLLACHYIIVELDSTDREEVLDTVLAVGHGLTATDSTIELQMIKPESLAPDNVLWDLMFKNVYYLGATGIDPEGFEVKIWNMNLARNNYNDPSGVPYITQFDLDNVDASNELVSDEIIDFSNANIVNMEAGELHFPMFLPFANDSLAGGNQNPDLQEFLGTGTMYTSVNRSKIEQDKHWELEVQYTNKSSTINLSPLIVEGSDQVFMDGVELQRGVDYQVDYYSGTLVLDQNIDPNANLKVLYDKHELVSFDKKTLMGTRAQMDLGEKSFVAATALYYNQSIINEKVEVGFEPKRNFLWDVTGRYGFEFDNLTRAMDRLPIIETDVMSALSFEGEISQILPNPNPINNPETGDPNGVAFIDDFEGSKLITSIPVQRRYWKTSSAPYLYERDGLLSQRNRAKLIWFNPYAQVLTKDIWPNQSTSIRAQNETTDILNLRFRPRDAQAGLPQDSIWAGITTPLYSGDYNQTDTKFFEIWVYGEKGKLSVNFGRISEDQNGDKILNTEDKKIVGFVSGNGSLEDGEDIGLDGCTDDYEDGWGGCLDTLYADVVDDPIWADKVYSFPDRDVNDPNGDNWSYQEGSSNYSKINGTEGNVLDMGYYPDTESLDRSSELLLVNKYFTKSIFLADTTYLAGRTKKSDGTFTGWKLYRIPLNHFARIDTSISPAWTKISHLRLVVTDTGKVNISIAKIELVGNNWQELGIAADTTNAFSKENADSIFAISVVNTEDNDNYTPPKGVRGEYDRINGIQSKEQSLVMIYEELPAHYRGAARKGLGRISGADYLQYDRLKMYVYGEESNPWIGKDTTEVDIFLRFGQGNNWYEIIQPVYSGWDEIRGRNAIEIDLDWLTRLKLTDSSSVIRYSQTDIFQVDGNDRLYTFTDEEGVPTGKTIKIKGKPALSNIKFFTVGVINNSDEPISGAVWIDEMRLSGVKKNRGVSMRLQSKFNLADLVTTTFLYSRKDADFHVLQKRLGSNNNTENFSVRMNAKLHKLVPKSWGVNLPVNVSFSKNEGKPKYYPDTDVLVDLNNVPDSIKTQFQKISFGTSFSKTSKSDNRFVKATIDKINPSFTASKSRSSDDLNAEVLEERYSGTVRYSYPFSRDNYIKPFKWLEQIPWIGKQMSELHVYYTPSSINTNVQFNETLNKKTKRIGGRSPDNYSFGLQRTFGLDYNLTDKLKTKYSKTVSSDMRDNRGYAWLALRNFDLGIVENITESLNTSFNPQIFTWLKPNFNHNALFRWNQPRASNLNGAGIGTNLGFKMDVRISPKQIFELFYKPPDKANRSTGRKRGLDRNENEETEQQRAEKQKENPFLDSVHEVVRKFNPITLTYNENLKRTGRGVQGEVPAGYKFGWLPDHGLDYSKNVGSNLGLWAHKRDFSIRSGINISHGLSTSLNYSQNVSTTRGTSNIETRTMSRGYLSWGEKLENGIPFFGWTVQWSGVEKWPLLSRIARTASLEHAMSGKDDRNWIFQGFDEPAMPVFNLGSFIDEYMDDQRSSMTQINFSPLFGLTMYLKKGIKLTIRHSFSKGVKLDNGTNGLEVTNKKTWTAGSGYSHRGGFVIPLPFMEDLNVQNTVNFDLNLSIDESETLGSRNGGADFGPPGFNNSLNATLNITYSFSAQVSGGIRYEYGESESKASALGKTINRDFGFNVNIAIRG